MAMPRYCEVRMKIVIQRHTSALLRPGPFQDVAVLGTLHADFADMDGVYAALAKKGGRRRSESLIEE
jgi:hypothetical protein